VRTFALPLDEGEQQDLLPPRVLPGWTWFAPHQTPEQVALVTDAGEFAAFGLKQHLSHDPPLFALFQESLPGGKAAPLPPRPQGAHGDGNNYWVLAGGKLYRLEAGVLRAEGPKLQSAWEAPLDVPLGSPLQAGQVLPTSAGESALFLLTRQGPGGRCLLSALETPYGALRWQQQLGLSATPLLAPLGDGVVAVDRQGHALVFGAAPSQA